MNHTGGFYERLVKSVKTPFKKTLVKAMLTEEKNEDNNFSSRGSSKLSPLDVLQR